MSPLYCLLVILLFAGQSMAAPVAVLPEEKDKDICRGSAKQSPASAKQSPGDALRRPNIAHKLPRPSSGLIPPPPPSVPLGGQFFYMGGPAFLTLNDVKKHRDKVNADLV